MSSGAPLLSPTAAGTSVFVGTVDNEGPPACCRGIAVTSPDNLRTATVYVPMATSREVLMNIASTKRLAVVASFPPDHRTTQLKGTMTAVRLASEEEAGFVRGRLEEFADVIFQFGVSRRLGRSMTYWPAFAIDVAIEEMFEQTPGPKAGVPIR